MPAIMKEDVQEALRIVRDPDLGRDIVSLGFVKNIRICEGNVAVDLELTTPACPVKDRLQAEAVRAIETLPGVTEVKVFMTAQVRSSRTSPMQAGLKGVKNMIAVASGKGGVGKSTVAVNLALALAKAGARVGLLDADIYGPSIPVMLSGAGKPEVLDGKLVPMDRYGVKFMSIGLMTEEGSPVIWRGPMATKLIQQFLSDVNWGELDYLLIDLPPGTGDVQLTLTQAAPLTGAVLVTTPQEVAVGITVRGLKMFQQVQVPVLGIVENMSYFHCPHCDARTEVFTHGGGERMARELGLRFLGAVPLDPKLTLAGDAGRPVVDVEGEGRPVSAEAFERISRELAAQVSIVNEQTATMRIAPTEVTAEPAHVVVKWNDGVVSRYPFFELRCLCPCAVCVDEWTGQRRLEKGMVPPEVKALEIRPVGRYAVQISWSDGHSTGIYSYSKLREIADRGIDTMLEQERQAARGAPGPAAPSSTDAPPEPRPETAAAAGAGGAQAPPSGPATPAATGSSPNTPNTSVASQDAASSPQNALRGQIIEAIRTVFDPEIPVNIYELGLIYDVSVEPSGDVGIRMTLTSAGCPAAEIIPPEVERKVKSVPGVKGAKIEVVWDPPWNPSMMSEAARLQLNLS